MKNLSSLVVALCFTSSVAFAPQCPISCTRKRTILRAQQLDITPELEAAIADVREAASEFGEQTAHFANVWIDRTLEGNMEGTAAGILEECVLDDNFEKCERFSKALTKLDQLLGVGAKEQF